MMMKFFQPITTNESDILAAEGDVWKVPGVMSIDNNITVKYPHKPLGISLLLS
jgi:hypothetical protein